MCDDGWGSTDAKVVCRQLGYDVDTPGACKLHCCMCCVHGIFSTIHVNTLYVQLTHTVTVPTLDKEVGQSYLMMWGVLGQSLTSSNVATMVLATITVVTVRMLVLCAQEVSHLQYAYYVNKLVSPAIMFGRLVSICLLKTNLWQFHVHMERFVLWRDPVRMKGE